MGFFSAALLAAPALAHAQPLDLFYERTVMRAADGRCGLFTPEVSAALAAGQAQARGAALRAGVSPSALQASEQLARAKAGAAGCGSADIAMAAQRVRSAFSGFSRISRLTYPGDMTIWQADRLGGRESRWRLKQEVSFGTDRLSFGLAGRGGADALVGVGRFADGAAPYGARLLLRDTRRSAGPYLQRASNGPTAGLPLDRRLPPREVLIAYLAEAREPAGRDLLPKGETGWAFRFPASAVDVLARLDPREAVMIEFLFPGDRVRRAYVEVGDFAAGRAFLAAAAR